MPTTPDDLRREAVRLLREAEALDVKQATAAELAAMTPAQINDARRQGRLDELLSTPTHPKPEDTLGARLLNNERN